MRNVLILIFLTALQTFAIDSYSQNTVLSLDKSQVSVKNVLHEIENNSEFYFLYNSKLVNDTRIVDAQFNGKKIDEILAHLFTETGVDYFVIDRQIILSPKEYLAEAKTKLQSTTITGTVTDENGEPIPGSNIAIKGTTIGTITDLEGKYSIEVGDPSTAILVFSYIGYHTQEIAVENQTEINVSMQLDILGLEEVVVIGYGTQKKIDITGSVESIDGAALARQPVFQTSQALVGLSPGLTAIQSSGQPGRDAATLRIRGIGTLGSGAKNDPLILIDGVQGSLNGVDANNIEDISVLKDASAAAIYGSRAANGVIIVTTKRAKENEFSVNYSTYAGIQKVINQPEFLGVLDYLPYEGKDQAFIDNYAANMNDPDNYPDTDWVKELFTENGFQQYHNLNVNAGSSNVKVLASLSYMDQDANIVNYNYKRYSGMLNTDIKVNSKLDISFDLNFRQSLTKEPYAGLSTITRNAYRIPPSWPGIHSDGSWGIGWNGNNPMAQANDGGLRNTENNYFRGLLRADYRPIEGLNLSVMYSPEYGDSFWTGFDAMYQYMVDYDAKITANKPTRNYLSQQNSRSFSHNFNAVASYDKSIEDHDFTLMAGYEFVKDNSRWLWASRRDFLLQEYQQLPLGSEETWQNSGGATHSGLVSYFGRLNYDYQNKYLFQATVRRDASSRFASENRVSIFPSVSAGWMLSEESFMKSLDFISNLKIRGSWGELGNQQIGNNFPYQSTINIGGANYLFGGSTYTGAVQGSLANPAIQWETTETSNIGLDGGLFDRRLYFSVEYYIKKTKDILLTFPVPMVGGLSAPTQNAGNVENKGWDASLGWNERKGDFSYNARIIFSTVENTVTNLGGVGPIISGNSITQVGSPIGSIYAYESIGIFQDQNEIDNAPAQIGTLIPGNIRYKDQLTIDTDNDGIPDEADGAINANDRVIIGNPFPSLHFGLDFGAEYKGFDLSLSIAAVGKRDILLGGDAVMPLANAGKVQKWHVEEAWTPENTGASFPIIAPTSGGSNDALPSNTWIFDGAYIRLRNITVGYSLPSSLLNNVFLSSARVYFSGQNLLTFDKLPQGQDPFVPNGSVGAIFPIVSTFTFGLDVQF